MITEGILLAWLKAKPVIAAWRAYGKDSGLPSHLRPKSGNDPINSFEAWDCVENAIIEVCEGDGRRMAHCRQMLKITSAGYLVYSDDPAASDRDAVIIEVARRW